MHHGFFICRENVSYASVCNTIGMALGMFISSISVNLLASEKFCNEYMRITPGTGGIISIKSTYTEHCLKAVL